MLYELAQSLIGTPVVLARIVLVVLVVLLLAAAWFDARQQRIPNALVASGAALAVLLHMALPGGDGFLSPVPGGLGMWGALAGLGLGALALLPLYALGGMGAGDVKLLAMLGAFLGLEHLGWALLAAVFAGGLLAIAAILRHRLLGRVLQNLRLMWWNGMLKLNRMGAPLPEFAVSSAIKMPFGVAIAAGGIAYVILRARSFGLV